MTNNTMIDEAVFKFQLELDQVLISLRSFPLLMKSGLRISFISVGKNCSYGLKPWVSIEAQLVG